MAEAETSQISGPDADIPREREAAQCLDGGPGTGAQRFTGDPPRCPSALPQQRVCDQPALGKYLPILGVASLIVVFVLGFVGALFALVFLLAWLEGAWVASKAKRANRSNPTP